MENKALGANALKFLQQKIEESNKQEIRTLTSADYDVPEENPRAIALWNLPDGLYRVAGATALARGVGSGGEWWDPRSLANKSGPWGESLLYIAGGQKAYQSTSPHVVDGCVGYWGICFTPARNYDGGDLLNRDEYSGAFEFSGLIKATTTAGGDLSASSYDASIRNLRLGVNPSYNKGLFTPTYAQYETRLGVTNLEVGDGLKITTTGSGANTKVKIELVSSDEESF